MKLNRGRFATRLATHMASKLFTFCSVVPLCRPRSKDGSGSVRFAKEPQPPPEIFVGMVKVAMNASRVKAAYIKTQLLETNANTRG